MSRNIGTSYSIWDRLQFLTGTYLSFEFAWRVGAHRVFLFLASALVLGQCAFLGAHHLESFPISQRDTTPVSTLTTQDLDSNYVRSDPGISQDQGSRDEIDLK